MSKPQDERRIYGLNACQSFFQRFPDRIIRAWLSEDAAKIHFGNLMKYLAKEKRAYHLADDRELEKVTQSEHHEGVCLLVQDFPLFTIEAFVATLPPGKPVCLLALDGVSNPHNLGAIMRVAAHYGVSAILTDQPQLLRSGAAMRTAEGGATHIKVVGADNMVKALQYLKKCRFSVLATSSHESASVYELPMPEKTVLILGEEQKGVSGKLLQIADRRIAVSGTGWVESLNVSVATGILLSEFWRQHRVLQPAQATTAADSKPPSAPKSGARPRPAGGARSGPRGGAGKSGSTRRPTGTGRSGAAGKSAGKGPRPSSPRKG